MRTLALALTLALTGCASNSDALLRALQNLEHCDRQYVAGIGMGAGGSLNIQCKARPFEGEK